MLPVSTYGNTRQGPRRRIFGQALSLCAEGTAMLRGRELFRPAGSVSGGKGGNRGAVLFRQGIPDRLTEQAEEPPLFRELDLGLRRVDLDVDGARPDLQPEHAGGIAAGERGSQAVYVRL